jgi:hypothetical protein
MSLSQLLVKIAADLLETFGRNDHRGQLGAEEFAKDAGAIRRCG